MSSYLSGVIDYVGAYPQYAIIAVFLLAWSEAIPIVGTILPGSTLIIGISALATGADVSAAYLVFAATLGAIAGDGSSFWLGKRYHRELLSRERNLKERNNDGGAARYGATYPRIIEAVRSIVIDGEAVVCGKDGKSDFDQLHSGAHDAAVFLFAFDLIELDGEDIRPVPLEQRKGKLEKLLARSNGIQFSEHLAGDGATIFAHACKLGLEGIVSKRRDLPYRSGRCRDWIKVKNPASPAVLRIQDGTW